MTGVHRRYLIIGNQKNNFAGLSIHLTATTYFPRDNTSKNPFLVDWSQWSDGMYPLPPTLPPKSNPNACPTQSQGKKKSRQVEG
jgi:hypothetical protein